MIASKEELIEKLAALPDETVRKYEREIMDLAMIGQKTDFNQWARTVLEMPDDAPCGDIRALLAVARVDVQEEFDGWVALVDSLSPAGKPSMRQDGEAHRKSEVELFAGTIVRRAQKHGLDVPVNRWLYETVRGMEAAY